MPLTHLVLLGLLVLPLPALAQSETGSTPLPAGGGPDPSASLLTPTSAPWRLVYRGPSDTTGLPVPFEMPQSRSAVSRSGDLIKIPDLEEPVAASGPFSALPPVRTDIRPAESCYAIRSYVVARDEKDSDSTHLVHYSVCQPASRYRLRTAQAEIESPAQ
jgi:hypothetical protein